MEHPDYKYKYIHKKRHIYGCDGIAFYMSGNSRIRLHERILAENVIFPDGSKPLPHTPFICGSCGASGRDFGPILIECVELNNVE